MAYNKITYNNNVLIDLTGDTVEARYMLSGKTAHDKAGNDVVGTMVNRGSVSGTIGTRDATYTIQEGYHTGSGSVGLSATEKAKIIAGNIKNGVSILGVDGTYGGASVTTREVANATGTGYEITVG